VPAGVTFGEGTIAGIFMEARYIIGSLTYNVKPGYMKKGEYVEPVKAPQLRLGNLGSFGD
jgi:hypothetical protein